MSFDGQFYGETGISTFFRELDKSDLTVSQSSQSKQILSMRPAREVHD